MSQSISRVTRRNIIEELSSSGIVWHGRLSEVEFLNRIFNLENIRVDYGGETMERYILRHRVWNPYDLDDGWVFDDTHLDLLNTEDTVFVKFLCEMIHPEVRNNPSELHELLRIFNENLKYDGYQIVSRGKVSGRDIYGLKSVQITAQQKSPLSSTEQAKFEKLFGMASGYVIDFSNITFNQFFVNTLEIDIFDEKYNWGSGSKANRMRAFWSQESAQLVGKLLKEMLEYWKTKKVMDSVKITESEQNLYTDCLRITEKLLSDMPNPEPTKSEESTFLGKDFEQVSLIDLDLTQEVVAVLSQRFREIEKCFQSDLPLSAIFLIGSSLEGILFGIASKNQARFNKASSSPKTKEGDVRRFSDWTLGNFIDVAFELGLLDLDVKKHSHSLRDFRNFIHPHLQVASKFNPTKHTAEISYQVLKAAVHCLSTSLNKK